MWPFTRFQVSELNTLTDSSATYLLWSFNTGETYVGSSGQVGKRISQHKTDIRAKRHHNENLYQLLQNQSIRDFEVIVIFTKDREEAFDIEQALVKHPLLSNRLLNIAEDVRSSMKGMKLSPEHQQALLNANIGRVNSPEARENISQGLKKAHVDHPEYGLRASQIRKTSEKTINQFKEVLERKRRRILVDGVEYESLTQAAELTEYSASYLNRQVRKSNNPSIRWIGENVSPIKGRPISEEKKQQLSHFRKTDSRAKAQLESIRELTSRQIILNGVLYPSILEAARQTGIHDSTIRAKLTKTNGRNTEGPYVLDYKKPVARKPIIDGIVYDSVRAAAEKLNVPVYVVKHWIRSGKVLCMD